MLRQRTVCRNHKMHTNFFLAGDDVVCIVVMAVQCIYQINLIVVEQAQQLVGACG